MKYRTAYCYDSSLVDFPATGANSTNAYIEEIMPWKKTKSLASPEIIEKRLSILRQNLDRTVSRTLIYTIAVALCLALNPLTKYWIIPFAVFLPLALRYGGHYLTLIIAIGRATRAQ